MNQNRTEKQHFIPQFYLRRFADAEKWVQILDLKRSKIVKPRSYPSICWRKFFYSTTEGEQDDASQTIEELFERIETIISKDWDGVLARAKSNSLQLDDFLNIAKLTAMLMLRTKASRDNFNMNQENMDKSIYDLRMRNEDFDNPETVRKYREILREEVSVKQLIDMRELLVSGEYSITYNNVPFLRFMMEQLQGFFNILVTQIWTVHRAVGSNRFITSENPVVEWAPKEPGFYQTPRLGHHQFLALSPEVMIKMAPSPVPDPFPEPGEEWPVPPFANETVMYKDSNDIDVLVYNFLLTGRGASYAYAQRRWELDELQKQYLTRGPAYRIYSLSLANGMT